MGLDSGPTCNGVSIPGTAAGHCRLLRRRATAVARRALAEWPSARLAGAPREASRSRPQLRDPGERMSTERWRAGRQDAQAPAADLADGDSDLADLLVVGGERSFPGDELAPNAHERKGQLGQDRERCAGACRHEVGALAPIGIPSEVLGPSGGDRHVDDTKGLGEGFQHARLARDRVDQEPPDVGSDDGQRDGGHAPARAEVDGSSRRQLVEQRQRDQRVEQVLASHLVRRHDPRQVQARVRVEQELHVALEQVDRARGDGPREVGEGGEICLEAEARGPRRRGGAIGPGHERCSRRWRFGLPGRGRLSAGSRIGPDRARLPYSATGGSRTRIVAGLACGQQPPYPRTVATAAEMWITRAAILGIDAAGGPMGRYDRGVVAATLSDATGPRFAHASEAELARILDFYQVAWRYEPDVYPISWNVNGAVVECFAPDFFLPEIDLYLELTTLKQSLVRKKNRKLRCMKLLYPEVRVKLLYARDFRALMLKYGRLDFLAEVIGTNARGSGNAPPVEAPAA